MKKIIWGAGIAITLLITTGVIFAIKTGTAVMQSPDSTGKVILLLLIAATIGFAIFSIGFAVFAAYFYFFRLPAVLANLAKETKWMTGRPENSWVAIERGPKGSAKFFRAFVQKQGHHLTSETDQNATIVETTVLAKAPVPTGTWAWLTMLLRERGIERLGFDAPALQRPATIIIKSVHYIEGMPKGTDLQQQLRIQDKEIHYLLLQFVRYVLVKDVETADAFNVVFLVVVQIEVLVPYKTWYALGGEAYKKIDIEIERHVRMIGQEYSLDDLFQGKDKERELELKVQNGIAPDLNPRLEQQSGVKVASLAIKDWDDDAPPEYREGIRAGTLQEQTRRKILAEVETRKQKATAGQGALAEEKKEADKLTELNKSLAEAIKNIAGKSTEAKILLTLLNQMGPERFEKYLQYRAIEKTGIQVAGGSTFDLAAMAGSGKEKPVVQPPTPKDAK